MYALVALLSLIVAATGALASRPAPQGLAGVPRRRSRCSSTPTTGACSWGGCRRRARRLAWWAHGAERRALLRDGALTYGAVTLLYLPWLPTPAVPGPAHGRAVGRAARSTPRSTLLSGSGIGLAAAWPGFAVRCSPPIALLAGIMRGLEPRARARWPSASAALAVACVAGLAGLARLGDALPRGVRRPAPPAGGRRPRAPGAWRLVALVVLGALLDRPADERRSSARATRRRPRCSSATASSPATSSWPRTPSRARSCASTSARVLRWANAMGPVGDPRIMDWRDALERLGSRTAPKATSDALVRPLAPGQQLLLVQPDHPLGRWGAPVDRARAPPPRSGSGGLDRDPRLVRVLAGASSTAAGCPAASARPV